MSRPSCQAPGNIPLLNLCDVNSKVMFIVCLLDDDCLFGGDGIHRYYQSFVLQLQDNNSVRAAI